MGVLRWLLSDADLTMPRWWWLMFFAGTGLTLVHWIAS